MATLIYALPAAIRITTLGIRGVPPDTLEAASAFGATGMQRLRKVELPLARRAIALGINQTIMLSLSMVVIAGLIGAPGLARNIVIALSKVDVGTAFDAGLAIVILAIVLVYGSRNPIGSALVSIGFPVVYALPGMVLATVFVSLPLVLRECPAE